MPAGRKPKPNALKQLAGNPGKRPLSDDISDKLDKNEPEMPAFLSKLAQKYWHFYVDRMFKAGIWLDIDVMLIADFCVAASEYEEICREINKKSVDEKTKKKTPGGILNKGQWVSERTGYAQVSPMIQLRKEARATMDSAGARLGLDPSSRSRLRFANVESGEKSEAAKEEDRFFGGSNVRRVK